MILYHQTLADKCNKILEVGVGTGRSSQMFTQSFMKQGAVYINTDISEKMIEIFKKNLSVTGYDAEYQDTYTEILPEDDKKKIAILKANNEELPFPDEEFDCYISNLSLHIVNNHHNQLLEAYRVLKPESKAGFTVWGNRSRCRCFTFLEESLKKHDYDYSLDPSIAKSFEISDPVQLRKDTLAAGFKIYKTFVVNLPFASKNPEDFLNFMVKGSFDMYAKEKDFDDATKEDLWNKVSVDFDTQFGPDSPEIPDFEQIVIIATK
uniref:Methyltransferase type 11 domain-containing protein n=1 Tax=Euplotes crassus TaxID=5936 RepID=A0A7S3NL54_EUPCR